MSVFRGLKCGVVLLLVLEVINIGQASCQAPVEALEDSEIMSGSGATFSTSSFNEAVERRLQSSLMVESNIMEEGMGQCCDVCSNFDDECLNTCEECLGGSGIIRDRRKIAELPIFQSGTNRELYQGNQEMYPDTYPVSYPVSNGRRNNDYKNSQNDRQNGRGRSGKNNKYYGSRDLSSGNNGYYGNRNQSGRNDGNYSVRVNSSSRNSTRNLCCADCRKGDMQCLSTCKRTGCKPQQMCEDSGKGAYAAYCQQSCASVTGFALPRFAPDQACRGQCAAKVQNLCMSHSCKDFGCVDYNCSMEAPSYCG